MSRPRIERIGSGTGSFKSYATGFILAILLTVIPFFIVITGAMSGTPTLILIYTTAIVQILVHLHYFLHLNSSSSARWNVIAMVFTILIIVLFVGGTIWIIDSLRYRLG